MLGRYYVVCTGVHVLPKYMQTSVDMNRAYLYHDKCCKISMIRTITLTEDFSPNVTLVTSVVTIMLSFKYYRIVVIGRPCFSFLFFFLAQCGYLYCEIVMLNSKRVEYR